MILFVAEMDGRAATQKDQEQARLQAARLLESGMKPDLVARALGRSRAWAFDVARVFREGGVEALAAVPRPEGRKKLDSAQRAALAVMIEDHTPAEYGFDVALWTRELVGELVFLVWGVELSAPTVGKVLRDLGFSPQKPLRKAFEQDPDAVARWEQEEFPEIRRRAREEGADLYFGDEAHVRSDYHSGRTWAPVGKTPVVPTTGSRKSVSMLSAINLRGKISFDVREGGVDSDAYIEFCEKLLADADGRKVFLIVDNASYHVSRKTREFAVGTNGKLTLFFLPTYAPELNPDELVWKHVKHDNIGKASIRDAAELRARAVAALQYLRDTPDVVKAMFRKPRLAYIHA
jgi:transposase